MQRKGNKKISSIFENCHETASQEIYLRRCGFALQGHPPDSDPAVVGVSPPLNNGVASQNDSESDSLIASGGYDAVETEAIRFVSPPQSTDSEDTATDRTVPVESEDDAAIDLTVPVESEVELLSSGNRGDDERLESPAKEKNGGKKLKVPLRDVVKAIVMNSRNEEEEEEDKEIEKMSYVQILAQKGFKFP